jgi:hypothetical protein
MLTIRREQLTVFSEVEVRRFEDWTTAHLKKFFPKECAIAGDVRLRNNVQHGIARARAHGITAKRDVVKYIDLMMVFGRDFDTDKRLRWAADILAQRRHPDYRLQSLLRAAKLHLKKR